VGEPVNHEGGRLAGCRPGEKLHRVVRQTGGGEFWRRKFGRHRKGCARRERTVVARGPGRPRTLYRRRSRVALRAENQPRRADSRSTATASACEWKGRRIRRRSLRTGDRPGVVRPTSGCDARGRAARDRPPAGGGTVYGAMSSLQTYWHGGPVTTRPNGPAVLKMEEPIPRAGRACRPMRLGADR